MAVPYQEIAVRLAEIEKKYDLLQYQVDGWSVWTLFRLNVGIYCLGGLAMADKTGLSLTEALAITMRDLPGLLFPPRSDLLVLSLNSARSEQTEGGFKDVFFDDLLQGRDNFIKIEDFENQLFSRQSAEALIPSRASIVPFRLLSAVPYRMHLVPKQVRQAAEAIGAVLRGPLGLSQFTPSIVTGRICRFYWAKRMYKFFLNRVRPRKIIHIGAHFYELFAAARELGIEVIEFQHGFLDRRTHVSYAWGSHARRYKENLPITQRLLLYGEHWRQELASDGFWEDDQLRVVGSLRMDDYRRRRTTLVRGHHAIPRFFWSSDGIEVDAAIQFMRAALQMMGPTSLFELTVKLHPHAENRAEPYHVAFGADPRVRVLLGNESPSTFDLLSSADLHLSGTSTCHYEAVALGIPTIILPIRSHEKVLDLVEGGNACVARDPAHLGRMLANWRELTVAPRASEYYFCSNALTNIRKALA